MATIIMNEKNAITARAICEFIPSLLTADVPSDMAKAIEDFCAKTIAQMDKKNASAKKKQTDANKVAMTEAEKLYDYMIANGTSRMAKDWYADENISAIVTSKAKFAHRMGILEELGKVEISRTTKSGANWYRAI